MVGAWRPARVTLDAGAPRGGCRQDSAREPSRGGGVRRHARGRSSPDSRGHFFFPPIVKFSLFFFCTCSKRRAFSHTHTTAAWRPSQGANLVHGVVDLLQLFVTISGLSERLNHGLLDLREQLEHTRAREQLPRTFPPWPPALTFITVSNMGMSTNLMKPI